MCHNYFNASKGHDVTIRTTYREARIRVRLWARGRLAFKAADAPDDLVSWAAFAPPGPASAPGQKEVGMGLFSKAPLDADFESALHKLTKSHARAGISKSQEFIRHALQAGEELRLVLFEEYPGALAVVVTDRRLLLFKTAFNGMCKELEYVCDRSTLRNVEVDTNWQTRSTRVLILAENFRAVLKVEYPATGRDLVTAAEELSATASRLPAPRLAPDFFSALLRAAGFPLTEHNLFAITERVGSMFLIKARQYIGGEGTARELAQFDAEYSHPGETVEGWPQRILEGLVDWDADVSPYIQDLPESVRRMLLESVGKEGRFFGPDPSRPLPTLAEF
jgi:hypothetical protein